MVKMLKIDLHTHSIQSPDGGISEEQYIELLGNGTLDYVAITDHDTTHAARRLHKTLGEKIIVGQEITTREGELIGLFLDKDVAPGQSLIDTAQAIKKQGGLVYVPHPFETLRKGVTQISLDSIAELVDIVEVYNGRAIAQNKGPEASVWARLHHKVTAASSDAHGLRGVGTAYSIVSEKPTAQNLVALLQLGHLHMERPPMHTLLYPKLHRLRKKLSRSS